MGYLFDSNIFIRLKNDYPMDLWPSVWANLPTLLNHSEVYSSVKVKEEIAAGNDELPDWMNSHTRRDFYLPIDRDVLARYAEVQNWAATNPQYTPAAVNLFASVADAYIAATAAAKGLTVVSYEVSSQYSRRSVKLPDACSALGVAYCDLNTALRQLGITI